MADVITRKARAAKWWAEWWAEDYSWEGLANHEFAGDGAPNGAKTLKGYWLRDPATGKRRTLAALRKSGEIVSETLADGTASLWHIAHVPLHWRDGTPAKSSWNDAATAKLAACITARIVAATDVETDEKKIEEGERSSADRRAQLRGTVLNTAPAHPDGAGAALNLDAGRAWLPAWDASGQRFGPNAHFANATFTGDANFWDAKFTGDANFGDAKFTGDAHFWDANFTGNASFADAKFIGSANFSDATFTRDAYFGDATFTGDAYFWDANFTGDAYFRDATFTRVAYFWNATFTGDADFGDAKFEVELDGQFKSAPMRFDHARFKARAMFNDVTFARTARHHSAAFNGASFDMIADFQNSGINIAGSAKRGIGWIAALDEAIFEKSLLLDDPRDGDEEFDKVIARCMVAAESVRETSSEDLLKQLEGGARVAKVAMGEARDEIKEQQFYRMQLIARRAQLRGWTPKWPYLNAEWLVSHGFRITANYGLSLSRPLLGLGLSFLLFFGIYLLVAVAALPDLVLFDPSSSFDSDAWRKALAVSLNRLFPFGRLGDDYKNWLEALVAAGSPWWALFAEVLATVQSVVALIMIFLFGLALRRRFKVE